MPEVAKKFPQRKFCLKNVNAIWSMNNEAGEGGRGVRPLVPYHTRTQGTRGMTPLPPSTAPLHLEETYTMRFLLGILVLVSGLSAQTANIPADQVRTDVGQLELERYKSHIKE